VICGMPKLRAWVRRPSTGGVGQQVQRRITHVIRSRSAQDQSGTDCHACLHFYRSNEVAVVRGNLPKFAILPERRIGWLQLWAPEAENQTSPR